MENVFSDNVKNTAKQAAPEILLHQYNTHRVLSVFSSFMGLLTPYRYQMQTRGDTSVYKTHIVSLFTTTQQKNNTIHNL